MCAAPQFIPAALSFFHFFLFLSFFLFTTPGIGTLLWSAPEVLSGANDYTLAADVYSFAIVCFIGATEKRKKKKKNE